MAELVSVSVTCHAQNDDTGTDDVRVFLAGTEVTQFDIDSGETKTWYPSSYTLVGAGDQFAMTEVDWGDDDSLFNFAITSEEIAAGTLTRHTTGYEVTLTFGP